MVATADVMGTVGRVLDLRGPMPIPNTCTVTEDVAKPSSSKGRYIIKASISATTGPGIPVDALAKAE